MKPPPRYLPPLERLQRLDEKRRVADGQNFHVASFDAVDYTVVADKNLADVVTVQFADGAAGFGEVAQVLDRFKKSIMPIQDG